jgi:NitT/TauT family transport system substrate-binding protein
MVTGLPFRSSLPALLLLLAGFLAGCDGGSRPAAPPPPGDGSGGPRRVRLLLNWFPEAEHGGFYAAQVHGYYREAGLEVEIVPGGPNIPVVQQVAGGQMEFGVANADPILFGRAEGAPVVAVMAPLQVSPRCIMVHAKSGIRSFDQLRNVTLAMSSTSAFSHFLQHRFPLEGVRIVPYAGSVAQFLLDPKYAQQGYVFSEPHVARSKGADPHVLLVADAGFNPYTSCLFTTEQRLKEDPETVRKLVEASVRGWRQYLEAPEETNRRIHSLNPEMGLDVLAFGAKELKPLVLDAVARKEGIGHMTEARWTALVRQLEEIGQLEPGKAPAAQAFTADFLPKGSAASE